MPLVVVGLPLVVGDGLYNCAAVIRDGAVLGVVPKSYLANYREFYDKRYYSAARDAPQDTVRLFGSDVPFGADLLFDAEDVPGFCLHVEICEDGWVPIPPSVWASLAGATVLANLSGSPVTVGKESYRKLLSTSHSARCIAAHLYVAAGFGESTTDLAWDGDALITENGTLLTRSKQFEMGAQSISADIDLDRLRQERMRMTSVRDQVGDHAEDLKRLRRIGFSFGVQPGTDDVEVLRRASRGSRSCPAAPATSMNVVGKSATSKCRDSRRACVRRDSRRSSSAYPVDSIRPLHCWSRWTLRSTRLAAHQYSGLHHARLRHRRRNPAAGAHSDGLAGREWDRTRHPPVVRADARRPRPPVLAWREGLRCDVRERAGRGTDLTPVPPGQPPRRHRPRHGRSLRARLGWCTYGVGDQMSHYNVNGSVPKTLVRHLIRWMITSGEFSDETSAVLAEILADVISPELVPPGEDGAIQSTEDTVGPYELHDFFLYYLTRFGYRPSKVAYLARQAWGDLDRTPWDTEPLDDRNVYDAATIDKWLTVFCQRFMANQFKRTAMPNGPKIGSGGSLSPRGDWRSPSDASARAWLQELRGE